MNHSTFYLPYILLISLLHVLCAFFQPDALPLANSGEATSASNVDNSQSFLGPGSMNIGLLLLMIGVFYFLIIRPQTKRQKAHDTMLKSLKKGQYIWTSGGIKGQIVDLREKDVVLKIAEKTKINMLRSHIASIETEEKKEGSN